MLFYDWKIKIENAAFSRFTFCPYFSPVFLEDLPGQGQAYACSLKFTAHGPAERLKDALPELLRKADPVVPDEEDGPPVLPESTGLHPWHGGIARIFEGVGKQVGPHLGQHAPVAANLRQSLLQLDAGLGVLRPRR